MMIDRSQLAIAGNPTDGLLHINIGGAQFQPQRDLSGTALWASHITC